jgi:hypothetical protein
LKSILWGILINERILMSPSRFPVALWTIVILTGYAAIVCHRMKAGLEKRPRGADGS